MSSDARNFNGFETRAVTKILKYQWRRIVGKGLLAFKEFSVLITEIEACLNSRHFIALSGIPNDSIY
jgi:hypothetical protein